jgi:hypothetical protein
VIYAYINQALIFCFFVVIAQPVFGAGPSAREIPAGWIRLAPIAPNIATFAYIRDDKGKESFFSIQRHPLDKKMSQLKSKLINAKDGAKDGTFFGNLKADSIENNGDCFVLSLEKQREPASLGKSHSLSRQTQTWCFDKKEAWAVIEEGATRAGQSFISQVLHQNGFEDAP